MTTTTKTITVYECSECGGVAVPGAARGAPYCRAHPSAAVESYSEPVETPKPADTAATYTVTFSDVTDRIRLEVVRESDGADVTGRAYRQMHEAE